MPGRDTANSALPGALVHTRRAAHYGGGNMRCESMLAGGAAAGAPKAQRPCERRCRVAAASLAAQREVWCEGSPADGAWPSVLSL